MTREELFSIFPRPWRFDGVGPHCGLIFDADGSLVAIIDPDITRDIDDAAAMAETIVDAINGLEE